MDEIHRKVLQRNRPYLMKEVMLEPMWPHLVAREIFTDEMIEHIQATGAKPAQMQRLLSDLARRGPNAFEEFLDCLVETEQQHIVDKLRTTEKSLRAREPKYITPIMNSTPSPINSSTGSASHSPSFHGFSSAHTKQIADQGMYAAHPNYQAATQDLRLQPTDNNLLTFSSLSQQAANQSRFQPVATSHIVSQMSHPLSSTSHNPGSNGDMISPNSMAPSSTVTLMDCTTASSTQPTNSVSYARPTISFTASNSFTHKDNEESPDRADPSKEAVRKNLGSMFRSPVTQTDNGDGISMPSTNTEIGITTIDHPHGDINPYPEVLGIPQTSGRLKFAMDTSSGLSPNWNTMYKMTSEPRGYCLIINNRYFTGHLKERLGTDVDKDNLFMLYSQLGYQICVQENLTGMEMLLTLRDFSQLREHESVDSCVVVLLTHGLEGQIYGSDAKLINLTEVFSFFDGNASPGLQGKPKFFLVQACRGEKFDAGFDLPDNGQTDQAGPAASQAILDVQQQGINDMNQLSKKLPSGSDFLIAYATVPGFVSWRNSEQGSWFIQALCEVFSKQCKHEDALNMLVQVNNRVATIYESATKHKQMPSPVVLLRKKLYFFPVLSV